MKRAVYLIASFLFFISCSTKTDSTFEPETEADIIQYIQDNNLNATRSNSGLYYVINNEGSGARPTSTSNVTVAYKGYFLDGVVFDESSSSGISFGFGIKMNRLRFNYAFSKYHAATSASTFSLEFDLDKR